MQSESGERERARMRERAFSVCSLNRRRVVTERSVRFNQSARVIDKVEGEVPDDAQTKRPQQQNRWNRVRLYE